MAPLYQRIYVLVSQVPAGKVATYGAIGRLAGCNARTVGFAMAALKPGTPIPWQRIINAKGMVSSRREGGRDALQRDLLEAEGVEFDSGGRVDLTRFDCRDLNPGLDLNLRSGQDG